MALLAFAGTASHAEESPSTAQNQSETAIFAGGCFWCMEPPFDELEGVVSTTSGYAGGNEPDPSYEEVSAGETGHLEAMRVEFDPEQIGYEELLAVYWRNVDPLDAGGQFCDRGSSYQTAIFYSNAEQKRLAEQSKADIEASARFDEPIVTPILPATGFYPAEERHQDYYEKHPIKYKFYRYRCGRDARLEELWAE
ncbi:peptide-methionine (S)-S-oxide reductase MsrA [soil metagenome]